MDTIRAHSEGLYNEEETKECNASAGSEYKLPFLVKQLEPTKAWTQKEHGAIGKLHTVQYDVCAVKEEGMEEIRLQILISQIIKNILCHAKEFEL